MRVMILCLSLILASCGGVVTKAELRAGPRVAAHNHLVCLVPGDIGSRYIVLGVIKATKRTYGSVDELNVAIANEARHIGADAVINYQASQRFKGPIPWRLTSPTGVGTAVKLMDSGSVDCAAIRGFSG